jgi:hypothetical protein
MEHGVRSRLGATVKGVLIAGGLLVGARMYVEIVPYSAALGAILVIGAGATVAFTVLSVDRRIAELRTGSTTDRPSGL